MANVRYHNLGDFDYMDKENKLQTGELVKVDIVIDKFSTIISYTVINDKRQEILVDSETKREI